MKILFKAIGFIFALLFFVAAGLQFNDPDSLIWIIIWALAGMLALGFAVDEVPSALLWITGVVALGGFLYCYPEQFEGFEIGEGNIKNVEEGREAFGLLIIALILLLFAARKQFSKS